jgi:hypothetical protein
MTNALDASNTATPARLETQVDYILLDMSGSMAGKWRESISAIDAYCAGLKAEGVRSHLYLHLFSHGSDIDICAHDGFLSDFGSAHSIVPDFGGTALYDAISLVGQRISAWDCTKPGRLIIVTDGCESDSRFTDATQARSILDWLRALGWQITFIGADFSNAEQAAVLGSGKSEAIGVQQKLLSAAAANLAKKAARHARFGTDIGFSDSEQQQFGGYLAAPK